MNPFFPFQSLTLNLSCFGTLLLQIQNTFCRTYRTLNMRTLRSVKTSECDRPATHRQQSPKSQSFIQYTLLLRQTCSFQNNYTDETLQVPPPPSLVVWFKQPTCVFQMNSYQYAKIKRSIECTYLR